MNIKYINGADVLTYVVYHRVFGHQSSTLACQQSLLALLKRPCHLETLAWIMK